MSHPMPALDPAQTPCAAEGVPGHLTVIRRGAVSVATSVQASNPLKLLVSRPEGAAVAAYASTYGGGLLAGDAIRLDVTVGDGARLFLGTQSSTKVFRSGDGRPARLLTRVRVGADGVLASLPDPVTAYAEARFIQRQTVELATDASLVWLDGITAGRVARDERWAFHHWDGRLEVRRDGAPLVLDALRLDGAGPRPIADRLGPMNALATLVLAGPRLAGRMAALREEIAAQEAAPGAPLLAIAGGHRDDVLVVRLAAVAWEPLDRWLKARLAPLDDLIPDDPWLRRP